MSEIFEIALVESIIVHAISWLNQSSYTLYYTIHMYFADKQQKG